MRSLLSAHGRQGAILPTGIATDDTTKRFFGDLVEQRSLVSLYSFENEEFVFPAVHHATKFCLLTLAGSMESSPSDFVFYARRVSDLDEPERHFTLTPEDFALLNPNTRTCPTFRSRSDAELVKAVYRRVPALLVESQGPSGNHWNLSFMQGLFNMASDSDRFQNEPGDLPLYELKMMHQFDHRYGTYEGQTDAQAAQGILPRPSSVQKCDPSYQVVPRYWIRHRDVQERIVSRPERGWLLGWRKITSSVASRTVVASAMPVVGYADSGYLAFSSNPRAGCLVGNLNAFALDWVCRQKLGGTNLNLFVVEQLPVLDPETCDAPVPWAGRALGDWLRPYLVELVATSWSLLPFARSLGWSGPPFKWHPQRREILRAELDAAYFLAYGLDTASVDSVLESFWVIRDNDVKEHGTYRTKQLVLEAHAAMAVATQESPFKSRLDPPPGDSSLAHEATSGDGPGAWAPWGDVVKAAE